jgi:hypothetical protein
VGGQFFHADEWTDKQTTNIIVALAIMRHAPNKDNNTDQQRFLPREKMSVSDVFLDAEFKHVSRISLSPILFALHQIM